MNNPLTGMQGENGGWLTLMVGGPLHGQVQEVENPELPVTVHTPKQVSLDDVLNSPGAAVEAAKYDEHVYVPVKIDQEFQFPVPDGLPQFLQSTFRCLVFRDMDQSQIQQAMVSALARTHPLALTAQIPADKITSRLILPNG